MGHAAGEGLTDQRILFCHNYLKYKFDGTKAAIKSGYSEKTARVIAYELLTIPTINDYIKKLIKEQLSAIDEMTLEWVQDVSAIQRANIKDVVKWTKRGVIVKASADLSELEAYPIAEISEHMVGGKKCYKIKLESKTKALELKAKYLGLMNDTVPAKPSKKDQESIEDKRERLAYLLKKRGIDNDG